MTKNDIVRNIASKLNIHQTIAKEIVQMTLDGIIDTLATEGRLELRNFGVFEMKKRKTRKARNPKTGEEVIVPERTVPVFKAGKVMMGKVLAEDDQTATRVTHESPNEPGQI